MREVVALQEAAGFAVVTDGELRRESFQSELTAAVEGVEGAGIDAWLWGDWHSEHAGERSLERPAGLAVTAPLRRRRLLASEEFTFLRAVSSRIAKVTLPSPTLFANLWDPERSREAYPRFDDFMADVVALLVDEVAELARLGCRYVQLDAPHYPLLIEPRWRRLLRAARLDARALAGLRHRARQRRDRRRAGGHLRLPSVPRQPGLALAGRGGLRRDRRADLRPDRRAATAARVRRRALGELRGAGGGPRRQGHRARARDDQDRRARVGRGARAAASRRPPRWSAASSASRSAPSAASRPRSSATASAPSSSGASSSWSPPTRGASGARLRPSAARRRGLLADDLDQRLRRRAEPPPARAAQRDRARRQRLERFDRGQRRGRSGGRRSGARRRRGRAARRRAAAARRCRRCGRRRAARCRAGARAPRARSASASAAFQATTCTPSSRSSVGSRAPASGLPRQVTMTHESCAAGSPRSRRGARGRRRRRGRGGRG